jgi:hypothetical protein
MGFSKAENITCAQDLLLKPLNTAFRLIEAGFCYIFNA